MPHRQGEGDQGSATEADQEAADELVSDTEGVAERFAYLEVARADGYEPMIGRSGNQPKASRPTHVLKKSTSKTERSSTPSAWRI